MPRLTRYPTVVAMLIATATTSAVSTTAAQDTARAAAKQDSTVLPLKPARKISFTTDEGTWISLDVSPDGKTIVFDLLGDLYTIPIEGGQARRLTSGMAWDCMPRWSPDGKTIAFITDRSGSDNLWSMNLDGGGLRAITKETDNTLSSPAWTPDGQYLVVRRFGPYPSAENFNSNIPLWMYHKDVGTGVELYPRKTGTATTNTGAAFTPDGRTVYFSSHSGGFGGERLDLYQIVELDRATSESRTVTSGYGGALRPIVSPDGRWLVYATRRDSVTALRIRDLRTLDEQWLVTSMQRDDQEGLVGMDLLPGYSFTPDSRAVIFTGDGKIKRVDVATKRVSVIPFTAQVDQDLAPLLKHERRIADGPIAVRQLMWLHPSPDGRRAAFTAVGKVYVTDLTGGTPRRLTSSSHREYAPAFSPDGRWVAFVSMSDSTGAQIMKVATDGASAPVALTPAGGQYASLTWSPDGDKIVYEGRRSAPPVCRACGAEELAWVSADGGEPHRILLSGPRPYSAERGSNSVTVIKTERDGERVYYTEQLGAGVAVPYLITPGPTGLVSVRLDGSDKRIHAKLTNSNGVISLTTVRPSPDGKWLLLIDRNDAYVAALSDVPGGMELNLASPTVPARRLTNEGANYASWGDGGRTITWSFVNEISRMPLDRAIASSREEWRPERFTVALSVPRATPQGAVVLRGARIVTMRANEIIDAGEILIQGNRIAQIGQHVTVPPGAKVIDVGGKWIIPGLIDVHAHPSGVSEMPGDQEWSIANHLAFGVTTTRNPAGNRMTFVWEELVDAGELVGPRFYGTGHQLSTTGASIRTFEDALHVVRRYKQQGANSLKQYLQPRRIQRQWIRMAADAEQMIATNEGEGNLKTDLTMVLDGYTAFEHSLSVVPIYKDVIQLIGQSGTTYTPTLIVAFGAPEGEVYWRAKWDMHGDDKVRRFTPHEEIDRKWRRHEVIIDEDFNFPLIARGVRDIVRAGGRAGMGAHGNQQGLGAQWELRMLQSGGLTPHEVLRIATLYGAESIGLGRDLGSLEQGKLADLLVLDADPLADINNAARIKYVVQGGVVREGETLNEVWPVAREYRLFPWRMEDQAYEALRRIK